ncbi:hypothetical protein [Acuticoccus sp.]
MSSINEAAGHSVISPVLGAFLAMLLLWPGVAGAQGEDMAPDELVEALR